VFIYNKVLVTIKLIMDFYKDKFLFLEPKIGTEAAFNIIMVANDIRNMYLEGLVFKKLNLVNDYIENYKKLIGDITNIDLHIFEIKEDNKDKLVYIRFIIYNKKYETDVKKIKSFDQHKLIGKLLNYSCPRNLGKKVKIHYRLSLDKNDKKIYQHYWNNPSKILILDQTSEQLFTYVCTKDSIIDYTNIHNIAIKCKNLLKDMKLQHNISIETTLL
jgi:hypothetical protein